MDRFSNQRAGHGGGPEKVTTSEVSGLLVVGCFDAN